MMRIVTMAVIVLLTQICFAEEAAQPPKETPPIIETAQSQAIQTKISPKKVEVDSNFDGKVDRTEIYDLSGNISRIEADTNGDGKIDDWITYDNGKPVQEQRDSNADGKIDIWIDY